MNKLAVVFPGQGSQYVGMGGKLLDTWVPAAEFFKFVDQVVGRPLSRLCLDGPKVELDDTVNAQPAVYAVNLIYWRWLKENLEFSPDFVAGHSLGEYTALTAAKVLDVEPTLRLVQKRADLMKQAAVANPGGMTAVIGLKTVQIKQALSRLNRQAQIANYNCPGQIVISGINEGLEAAEALLLKRGARKMIRLAVSGPFHSPLMRAAERELVKEFERIEFHQAEIPVINNFTAKPAVAPAEIKDALSKQITGPVRWEQSIKRLINEEVDTFIEVGPGKILKGLINRISPAASVYSIDDYENVDDFKSEWLQRKGGSYA